MKFLKSSLIKDYISLTKPGIIRGNLLTAAAGYFLASGKDVELNKLLLTLIGISLVIASACAYNNYIDRHIDLKMKRTSHRPLATGRIDPTHALFFASILLILGALLLLKYVSGLVFLIGFVGFVDYVLMYGYFKRRTRFSTLIGGISGATPPVAGYVAVTGNIDTMAMLLFLALTFWQMPHFFAIALFREEDYLGAGLPVQPIVKGHANTKTQIMIYIALFGASVGLIGSQPQASTTFTIAMLMASAAWLAYGIKGFSQDITKWTKGIFGMSLLQLVLFSTLLSLNAYLP